MGLLCVVVFVHYKHMSDDVQAAVRAEAHASLEPVRRLPQVLAAALPITDTTLANQVAQAGPLECALSSGERDWLQTTFKHQLEAASEQIIASQVTGNAR